MRDLLFAGAKFCAGIVLLVSTAGCVPLWVGALAAGAVGGYVVSPDTVEGSSSCSMEEAYDAARHVLAIMGMIQEENEHAGQIVAMVAGSRVTVTLLSVNASMTKISIKARKSFMPKIDLAQDVYAKITNEVRG